MDPRRGAGAGGIGGSGADPSRGDGRDPEKALRARARTREDPTVARIGAPTAARPRGSPRARVPRPLAHALEGFTAELAPVSLLGRVQTVWERATGADIAAAAAPVAERGGVLTVLCESSVWAHELEMLSRELIDALNSELGSDAIVKLRCRSG